MFEEIWAVCASLLLAVVPGGAVMLAARQRGWVLVASPLVTYGVVTWGGAACSALGVPWSILGLLLSTAVTIGVVVAVTAFVPQLLPSGATAEGEAAAPVWSWRVHAAVAACATVGGLFGATVLRRGMGSLNAINQDWDGVFHAAVVRWIADNQDMAQSTVAQLNNRETAETFFYPNTWHGLASVGWDLGVHSVPQLLNAGSLLVAVFLAFGIAALVLRMTREPVIAGAAAILVAMPSALVFDTLWRGPLIPFAVGLALVPALVVMVDKTLTTRTGGMIVVAGLAAGGTVGVHPSGAYTAMIFLAPWAIQRWITSKRLVVGDLLTIVAVGMVAVLVAISPLLSAMAASTGARQDWPAVETAGQAVGEALLLNHARTGPQWAIVVLAVIGVFGVRRLRGLWWFWVSGAIALGLFVASAAYDYHRLEELTAPWWNDRWRFAAMVAIFVVVLAAVGVEMILRNGSRVLADRTPLGSAPSKAIVGVALIGAFLVTSHGGYARQNADRMYWNFQSGAVVDKDDLELWDQAAEIIPEGQFVMNDPLDGSTWMLAMEGLRPFFGGMAVAVPNQPGLAPTQELLLFRFDELATNPEVRAAVEEEGIQYVVVGEGSIHGMNRSPGLDDLEDNPAFELVASVGGAQLFRIVD
ncbi:DUF6541 family protein [Sanguibacter suarezii]|uniref:DUF6541 family protein n=1 Tax=Sanguibacter suarezii TaxID=60921 RepID=UPI000AA88238|nr:DUF6541 family protein [Sanguibacter suarezii]